MENQKLNVVEQDVKQIFLAENNAQSCAIHALLHALTLREDTGKALEYFDILVRTWMSASAAESDRQQFQFYAAIMRRQIASCERGSARVH